MLTSIIAFVVGLFSFGGVTLGATPALTVQQGGTGTSTVPANYVLLGNTAGRLTAVATSSLGITAAGDGMFSTTSAQYFSSLGLAFSTTSALAHLTTIDKGFFFSTTSAAAWKAANIFESLTAGDGLTRTGDDFDCDTATPSVLGCIGTADWASFNSRLSTTTLALFDKGYFFSTTSASYFLTQNTGNAFSTTSANFWRSVGLSFSTTSANAWSAVGLGHSTTSVAAQLLGSITIGTLALTNDLAVAQGGTGVSTFGCTICILYSTAADGLNSETAFTYSAALDKMTVVNASTTNLTVNLTQIIGDGSGLSLVTPTKAFSIPYATTTAWTGTTTVRFAIPPYGMTVNSVWCSTNTGTLNVKLVHGATNMQMVRASSTIGQQTVSSNNVIVKGTLITADFGTPASSPTEVNCTFSGPQTSQ